MDGVTQPIQSEIFYLSQQLRGTEGDGMLIDCLTTIHAYLELASVEPKNSKYRHKLVECTSWLDRISLTETEAASILRASPLNRQLRMHVVSDGLPC
jgi:hypothetical protein